MAQPAPAAQAARNAEYQGYLQALLAGDRRGCQDVVEHWLAADTHVRVLYEELFRRSLYEVGTLWEQGRVSVATEHLATAISEGLLNLVYPALFNQPRVGLAAVVACSANEYHQIGGKMVADVFELHGWRGYFLGANTPLRDLLALIREKQPAAVALSLTVHFNFDALLNFISAIRTAFPRVTMLVGGQAFQHADQQQLAQFNDVHHVASLTDLEAWIADRTLACRPTM